MSSSLKTSPERDRGDTNLWCGGRRDWRARGWKLASPKQREGCSNTSKTAKSSLRGWLVYLSESRSLSMGYA